MVLEKYVEVVYFKDMAMLYEFVGSKELSLSELVFDVGSVSGNFKSLCNASEICRGCGCSLFETRKIVDGSIKCRGLDDGYGCGLRRYIDGVCKPLV